ncbi:MAG TPA: hypothetical protein VKU38_06400, partial [Ktedonobacteraceae bacterium]|nr:hypothetical protein [Ktedonobacteraceae bacterium]
ELARTSRCFLLAGLGKIEDILWQLVKDELIIQGARNCAFYGFGYLRRRCTLHIIRGIPPFPLQTTNLLAGCGQTF